MINNSRTLPSMLSGPNNDKMQSGRTTMSELNPLKQEINKQHPFKTNTSQTVSNALTSIPSNHNQNIPQSNVSYNQSTVTTSFACCSSVTMTTTITTAVASSVSCLSTTSIKTEVNTINTAFPNSSIHQHQTNTLKTENSSGSFNIKTETGNSVV